MITEAEMEDAQRTMFAIVNAVLCDDQNAAAQVIYSLSGRDLILLSISMATELAALISEQLDEDGLTVGEWLQAVRDDLDPPSSEQVG